MGLYNPKIDMARPAQRMIKVGSLAIDRSRFGHFSSVSWTIACSLRYLVYGGLTTVTMARNKSGTMINPTARIAQPKLTP